MTERTEDDFTIRSSQTLHPSRSANATVPSGEIDTTEQGVTVTLDPPDTPIHRRALRGLVDDLNTIGTTFPGTDVPVTYKVAMHHSELAA
jgi:hypothetical protein